MESLVPWMLLAAAVGCSLLLLLLLQKKNIEIKRLTKKFLARDLELQERNRQLGMHMNESESLAEQLAGLEDEQQSSRSLVADMEQRLAETDGLAEELEKLTTERDEQAMTIQALEDRLADSDELTAEVAALQKERDEKAAALIELETSSQSSDNQSDELAAMRRERDEKAAALMELKNSFEEQMDEVVQSSLQKITHAEQAKEEAIQAAQDNYEAAAEAHAQLKEKDQIIAKLQGP